VQDGIEARRKRAILRASRRGMREADLTLGPFAAAAVPAMAEADLAAFEALLEEADRDILAWVMGQSPAPAAHAGMVERLVRSAGPGPAGRTRAAT
jgi:antitoxin CptB